MMSIVALGQTVDIGGGRGRLTPEHAASLRRVDAEVRALVGRDLDVNSAWRDPDVQQKLRAAYIHYRTYGAPWAPIALKPEDSVHCKGGAIDTDDHRDPRIVRILNRHGWFQTVYRWENGKRVLKEPWHFERFPDRDQQRFDPAPAGAQSKEDDMTPDQSRKLDAVYAALFGARNLTEKPDPISWVNINGATQKANYGVLPIVIHNQTLIATQTGRLAAMEAVVEQLAAANGAVLDMAAIEQAAERGAKTALTGLTITLETS